MKSNYSIIKFLCILFISACSNNITASDSAKSWIGRSISKYESLPPKTTPIIRELSNGVKEYEYQPYQSNPSCTVTYMVDANGIIKNYRLSGKC